MRSKKLFIAHRNISAAREQLLEEVSGKPFPTLAHDLGWRAERDPE
jgi:hypothetical protein